MRVHKLKTWPEYFQAVFRGDKTFEVRKNDRDYKVGDILHLVEYHPDSSFYSGEELMRRVTYVLEGPDFGVDMNYVVMGVKKF